MTPYRIGFAGSLLLHGGLVGMWWALADTPEWSANRLEHSLPLTLAMFSEARPAPVPPPQAKEKTVVDPPSKEVTDKVQKPTNPAPAKPLDLAVASEDRAAESTADRQPQPEPAPKPRAGHRARESQPTRPEEAERRRLSPDLAIEPRRVAKLSGSAVAKPVAAIPTSADIAAKLEEEYLGRLWRTLERSKFYPRRARRRGVQGQVQVRFRVLRDGTFEALEVVAGSGSRLLDQAALQTVNKASGAVPFPSDLSKRALVVSLPITYRWH